MPKEPSHGTSTTEDASAPKVQPDAEVGQILASIRGRPVPSTEPGEVATTSSERARDDHGRFASDTATSEKPIGSKETTATVPDGVNPKDYDKATKALKLDRVPQKVIDSLSPQELIEWGTARAASHADVDRIKGELSQYKGTPTRKQAAPPPINWTEVLAPVAEYYGEEGVGPIQTALQAVIAQMEAPIKAMQDAYERREASLARTELSERWGVDEDARWQRVMAQMQADANVYPDTRAAVEAACKLCFADEVATERAAAKAVENRMRANGQPLTDTKVPTAKAVTTEELEGKLLRAIRQGDTATQTRLQAELGTRKDAGPLAMFGEMVGQKKR
jgi:hypothetical protein